jgi:nitrate reductase NapE component
MPSPHLERKLKETLGDDAGEELASVIDRIDPIRGDIAELRHAMQSSIEKSAREQTRFLFLAWGILLAGVVGLYGTVIALVR